MNPASAGLSILAVAFEFPALSETFVLDQVIGLLGRGHDVRVLADRPRVGEATHHEFMQHRLGERTTYLPRATSRGEQLGSLAALMPKVGPIRAPRILLSLILAWTRGRRASGEQGDAPRLLAILTALSAMVEPNIVICHFGPNGADMARAMDALGWTAPLVTLFYGFDLSLLVKQRGPRLYDHLFHRGHLFLPITDAFADRLKEMGCPADRLKVQRLGVDARRMDREISKFAAHEPSDEPFTFIVVARLVEKKGHAVTIRAFARVMQEKGPDFARLALVGDGPLRDELSTLVVSLNVADSVAFLGGQPRSVVLQLMLQAGALVQASITAANGDTEGLPVVITEAMALGLPVIATRHSSIPEVITNGITGLLVDEHDETGLAAAMIETVENAKARFERSNAARTFIEQDFDAAKWLEVLDGRLHGLARPA